MTALVHGGRAIAFAVLVVLGCASPAPAHEKHAGSEGETAASSPEQGHPASAFLGHVPRSLPPLHPILVNFTAALLPVSLLCDLLGRLLRRPSLTAAGWWTLLFAAVTTPFTSLSGWLWLRKLGPMGHPEMSLHQWLGIALAVLFVLLALWRGRLHLRGLSPSRPYLAACAAVFLALVLQGHVGGNMAFGADHEEAGAVASEPSTSAPAAATPERMEHHRAGAEAQGRTGADEAAPGEMAPSRVARELEEQGQRIYDQVQSDHRGSEVGRRLERFLEGARALRQELEASGEDLASTRRRFDEMVDSYCSVARSFPTLRPSERLNRDFDEVDSLMDRLLAAYRHPGCEGPD